MFALAFSDVKYWKINNHSVPFRNKIVALLITHVHWSLTVIIESTWLVYLASGELISVSTVE